MFSLGFSFTFCHKLTLISGENSSIVYQATSSSRLNCNIVNTPWSDYYGSWYALLTKREVKMAGYWPRSFLRFYVHLDQ